MFGVLFDLCGFGGFKSCLSFVVCVGVITWFGFIFVLCVVSWWWCCYVLFGV